MPSAMPDGQVFTGIDWASAEPAVCVLDAAGKITAQFTIAPSAEGIAALVRRLARYGDPAGLPVAIERPSGRLVDLLLEAGHPVVPVSPNAIKTWREGEVLSGAKSDAGDAAVIAGYPRLRPSRIPSYLAGCSGLRPVAPGWRMSPHQPGREVEAVLGLSWSRLQAEAAGDDFLLDLGGCRRRSP
jgi:Transposase